jgi:hypothetical protein
MTKVRRFETDVIAFEPRTHFASPANHYANSGALIELFERLSHRFASLTDY